MSMMHMTVIPKSDQLNFDDFIAGQGKIIKITAVKINPTAEQKCMINYENDHGKPYKPGKSMCRVLFKVWGEDESVYIGRSLELFGDPTVRFGAVDTGGIRISKMSHIDRETTVVLTTTRSTRKPFTVQPLIEAAQPSLDDWLSDIASTPAEGLEFKYKQAYKAFSDKESRERLIAAKDKRKAELMEKTP